MTIVEFLLARITEDEAEARRDFGDDTSPGTWTGWMLAECAAKRKIIEFHQQWPVLVEQRPVIEPVDDMQSMTVRMTRQINWQTQREYVAKFGTEPPTAPMLRVMAAVYADHPDFDETWR